MIEIAPRIAMHPRFAIAALFAVSLVAHQKAASAADCCQERELSRASANKHGRFASAIVLVTLVGCLLVGFNDPGRAASIARISDRHCAYLLSGRIEPGDDSKLLAVFAGDPNGVLCLNSEGGSFVAAIRIVDVLVDNGTPTLVRAGDRCYSACAIAFLGGSEQGDLHHISRSIEPRAALGFHAPHLEIGQGQYAAEVVKEAYDDAIYLIRELFERKSLLGISDEFFQKFILFMDHHEINNIATVHDLALSNISLQSSHIVGWKRREYIDACQNLFIMNAEKFKDSDGSAAPLQRLEDDELSKVTYENQFILDGQKMIKVSTVHDFESYTPASSCAFDLTEPKAILWTNDIGESVDHDSALVSVESHVPNWMGYPPSTPLSEIAE